MEPSMNVLGSAEVSMYAVDIVVLAVVILAFIFGLVRGFVMQLVQIGSLVAGFFLAKNYYVQGSQLVRDHVALGDEYAEEISAYFAFFVIFCATVAVLFFVSFLLRDIIKQAKLASYDRFLGGVFGIVKGLLICTALYYALDFWPTDEKRKEFKRDLQFQDSVGVEVMEWIVSRGKVMYPELFEQIEKKKPGAGESEAPPFESS